MTCPIRSLRRVFARMDVTVGEQRTDVTELTIVYHEHYRRTDNQAVGHEVRSTDRLEFPPPQTYTRDPLE